MRIESTLARNAVRLRPNRGRLHGPPGRRNAIQDVGPVHDPAQQRVTANGEAEEWAVKPLNHEISTLPGSASPLAGRLLAAIRRIRRRCACVNGCRSCAESVLCGTKSDRR